MSAQRKSVSLLIVNATVYTMDTNNLKAEALAIHDDRILEVGSSKHLIKKYSAQKVVDAKGQFIFPGFIDAHAHLFGLAKEKNQLDLRGIASAEAIAELVKKKVNTTKPGDWILGRSWDQNVWKNHDYPTHELLDHGAPNNPVFLKRIDGHAGWANARAMKLCGITASTSDTSGGKIIRNAKGEPTGIFIDNAVDLIENHIPTYSPEQMDRAYQLAIEECLRNGLTQIHDMGVTADHIASMKRLIEQNKFSFRVYALIDGVKPEWRQLLETGKQTFGKAQLILGGLKLYADGALGSRGALLFKSYDDDSDNSGLRISSGELIRDETINALKKDLQVCVHAIGDRANRIALDAFESARVHVHDSRSRLRIEHVQVLSSKDIPRFVQLRVIPSMQPTHCTSDMYWAEARIGSKRIRGAYAWHSLRKTGAIIAGGSDFPVEKPNPLLGIYAFVTRQDEKGIPTSQGDIKKYYQLPASSAPNNDRYKKGWFGDERLTREEAIRAFTTWAAYASHQENEKGSLEPGKLADFVILSDDIMKIPARKILTTKVLSTFIGGVDVYNSSSLHLRALETE